MKCKLIKSVCYSLLLTTAVLISHQRAEAHAIWIETAPYGAPAKAHTVRIYYGEYEVRKLENTADWYSDLRDLEVYVSQPGHEKIKLSLADKGSYLETTFVPQQKGLYFVSTSHATKELGGTMRYEFTSQVAVLVGNDPAKTLFDALPYQLYVSPQEYTKGDKITVYLTNDGQALAEQDIVVMSPSGWSKHYTSDNQGRVIVDALWEGVYVVEFGHTTQVNGTWHGNSYTENWQGITTSFLVE